MTGDGFDLAAVVRQVIEGRDGPWTLDQLIDAVDGATPAKVRRQAYRQALREYVRVAMTRHARPVEDDSAPANDTAKPIVSPPGRPNLFASRVALFRAGYRARIHAAPGVWKLLGDCTPEELEFAAAENERMAEANAAMAERYRRLAKVMRAAGAATVADLDASDVEELTAA